jgi:hypothetical protein
VEKWVTELFTESGKRSRFRFNSGAAPFYKKRATERKKKEERRKKRMDSTELVKTYNRREPHFPSYVDMNDYGICLRALDDLDTGTVVATASFTATDGNYIAGHNDEDHKYVAVIDVQDKNPVYGKIQGKWAFCNHSCDPNCTIRDDFEIITNRFIPRGQELTTSYDCFIPNLPWPEAWNLECLCQQPNCKKFIKEYRIDIQYPPLPAPSTGVLK